jgi:cytochrome c-type biogenesis protein CcmH/NrfG
MSNLTTRTTRSTRRDASNLEATLLARLGLPATASSQDVEAAHDALVEFLEGTPSDLRGWARQQIELIDEAFALLSDPTADRSALADGAIAAPALAPAPRAAKVVAKNVEPVDRPEAATGNRLLRRLAILGIGVVAIVAIAIAGFNLNGGTGVPPVNGTPAPEAAASPAIDQAQVADLMQKIAANPQDVASLKSLADLYYQANDFTTAGTFLEKILAIDPKNVTALLALGAVQFNVGDAADAEKQWRSVLAIDDQNVDAHYYLGFMYFYEQPPDVANVKLEWGKVMEIAPNSDMATTVSAHLASLEASPAPGASGSATSPAPSNSPEAIPAVSPAASGG